MPITPLARKEGPADCREDTPILSADDKSGKPTAERIMQVFPRWLVMWGTHSRRFWAYPCFDVPPGTIASAANPNDLAAVMHRIQRSATEGYR